MDKQQGPALTPYFWQRGYSVDPQKCTSVNLNTISLEEFEQLLDQMQEQINRL